MDIGKSAVGVVVWTFWGDVVDDDDDDDGSSDVAKEDDDACAWLCNCTIKVIT